MRYVYLIRNLTNGKVYVGQTKNFAVRKAGHLYAARKGNERPLYRAIRKHGEENFSFEILEECVEEVINEREQHWVTHFDSFNLEKGYNLTSGGMQNTTLSESTKQKLRELNVGERNPMFGRVGAMKGRPSPMRGRKHTSEVLERLRKNHADVSGEKNPMFGRKGEACQNAKLTQMQANEIRRRLQQGEKPPALGVEYGVSRFTIARIRDNQIYIGEPIRLATEPASKPGEDKTLVSSTLTLSAKDI